MKGLGNCNNRITLNFDNINNKNIIKKSINLSTQDLAIDNIDQEKVLLPSEIVKYLPENSELLSLYIGGSYSYGTNNENSDIDTRGVYKLENKQALGLLNNLDDYNYSVVDKQQPDITLFELKKTLLLIAKNNPAVLEMLFIKPYYKDDIIDLLYENRKQFITKAIFTRYIGFIENSIKKAAIQDKKLSNEYKRNKYYMHIYRLIQQGMQLAQYQEMNIKLENISEIRELSKQPIDVQLPIIEAKLLEFKKLEETSLLPNEINKELINNLFLTIQTS